MVYDIDEKNFSEKAYVFLDAYRTWPLEIRDWVKELSFMDEDKMTVSEQGEGHLILYKSLVNGTLHFKGKLVNIMDHIERDTMEGIIPAFTEMTDFTGEVLTDLFKSQCREGCDDCHTVIDPVSDWVNSIGSKRDLPRNLRILYKLCRGKQVSVMGVKYSPGVQLISAIRSIMKMSHLRFRDYVGNLEEDTGIPKQTIFEIIRYGIDNQVKSNGGLTEINRPEITGIEKLVDLEGLSSRAERRATYIEKKLTSDQDKVGKSTKKVKAIIRKLVEYWPVDKTEKLCIDLARDPKVWILFDVIANANLSECKRYYLLEVAYRNSVSRDSGREYADGASFQGLNGPMRRYMCNDDHPMNDEWVLKDIDIDNCFPVILYQTAKRYGIELKAMDEYVTRRDEILSQAMQLYGCDRGLAKKLFLIEMHGGSFWNEMIKEHGFSKEKLANIRFPFMDMFKRDIRIAYDNLKSTDEFRHVYEAVDADQSKLNKRGTFISYICQDAESMVISHCYKFCEKYGYDVVTFVFDGFMIKWSQQPDDRKHNSMDGFLRGVEDWVRDHTKFDLKFSNKPLELKPDDMKRLSPKSIEQIDHYKDSTRIIELYDMPVIQTDNGPRPVMHDFDDEKRCTIVTAGMYIGKSTTTCNYLRNKLQDPSATAIAISVRKQHARTLMGQLDGLGFEHYKDSPKSLHRQVRQYESLHKLLDDIISGVIKYDYVILDESHSIIKNVVSQTNKLNLKRCERTLRLILQMSKKVICLDADNQYDSSFPDYIRGIFDKSEMEHLWYKHQALKRTIIYTDQATITQSIRDDMANNRNIMVCFKSCSRLQTWYDSDVRGEFYTNETGERVQVKLGVKFGVRTFSSETNDEGMKVFENINDLPKTGLFLAFTSKVLVGSDILIPFHRIYLDAFGYQGPTPRQMLQMLGRGRVCDTGEIMVSMPSPKKMTERQKTLDYTTLYKSQFKDIQNIRQSREDYVKTILSEHKYAWNGESIEWTPDPILEIYAHDQVERGKDFSLEFHRLVHQKGYGIEFRFRTKSTEDLAGEAFDWNESLMELRDRKMLKLSDAVAAIKKLDLSEILRQCMDLRLNKRDTTKSEQIVNDALFAAKMFPGMYKDMTPAQFKYAMDNKGLIYMVHEMRSTLNPNIFLRDLAGMKYSAIPELAKLKGTYIKRMDRLLRCIGFTDGLTDRESLVKECDIHEKLLVYSSELNKMKLERGSDVRCRSGKNISKFRAELRQMGLVLKGDVKRHSKTAWTTSYKLEMNKTLEELIKFVRTNYELVGDDIVDRGDGSTSSIFRSDEPLTVVDLSTDCCVFDITEEGGGHSLDVKSIDDNIVLGKLDEITTHHRANISNVTAAGVIPWTIDPHGNQMILIQRMADGQLQDLGGKIEDGETPHQAAHREMMEESNGKIDFITQQDVQDARFVVRKQYGVSLPYVKYSEDVASIDYGQVELNTGYNRQVNWMNISDIKTTDLNWRIRAAFWDIRKVINQNS